MSYSLADMPKTKGRFEHFTKLLTEHAPWMFLSSFKNRMGGGATGIKLFFKNKKFDQQLLWKN
ncbi:hypothetical protein ACRRTK_020021 [Alexandromys fortis]